MSDIFENFCFSIYKSIKPCVFKALIPIIDFSRKLNNKPPIPLKEKMSEIDFPTLGDKVIMIHGVSVGEVLSLENLIKKVKQEFSDYQIVVTTGTVTGQELAHKKYAEIVDFITYFPLDVYEACKKFVEAIKPSVVLIAETELWPNFSYACKEKNIPLYIINGRISDKSYPSYLKIKSFLKLILKNYAGVFCQSEIDMNRFLSIGANKDNTCVMKNLKFEIEKKECNIDLKSGNSKVLIAGSTHAGEDEIALCAYKKLKEKIKDLKLIIAPRHLTRLNDVEKLVKETGFKYGFRTKEDNFEENDIIILDTLGELSKVYSLADVAYIGGSFNNIGGHNPLECVIYSKPAVSGPTIKNFRDIYSILERENASFVVKNEKEFYEVLEKLLSNSEYYSKISKNCESCFSNYQGALEFVIKKLKEILH
ncbi:3-deoxy-D-manno-octulosonic acid transferase [bacterium]|nr:3-deoxy-D-manno-octulosonic acid transferase [bacterium]